MHKILSISIHPFLLTIFPILFLYSSNMKEIPVIDTFIPCLITLLISLVLFLILGFSIKNWRKSGILVSSFVFLLFMHGLSQDMEINGWLSGIVLIIVFIVIVIVTLTKSNEIMITKILNVISFCLILSVTISVIYSSIVNVLTIKYDKEHSTIAGLSVKDNPNIYYIILDEYAGIDTLKRIFNYDNEELMIFLKSRGFYVANASESNYSDTYMSLPSSLNMKYLSEEEYEDHDDLFHLWANNEVVRLLRSVGYKYVYIGGDFEGNFLEPYVDEYYVYSGDQRMSMERANFGRELEVISPFLRFFQLYPFYGEHERRSVLYAFDKLSEYKSDYPVFIYAHILCPHLPFVFDESGNCPTSDIVAKSDDYNAYLEQLEFVNGRLSNTIDNILKNDRNAIIIVQSDHGWRGTDQREDSYQILNAYYLPNQEQLYSSISPVNSFRAIFNYYFGANYEILKDYKVE